MEGSAGPGLGVAGSFDDRGIGCPAGVPRPETLAGGPANGYRGPGGRARGAGRSLSVRQGGARPGCRKPPCLAYARRRIRGQRSPGGACLPPGGGRERESHRPGPRRLSSRGDPRGPFRSRGRVYPENRHARPGRSSGGRRGGGALADARRKRPGKGSRGFGGGQILGRAENLRGTASGQGPPGIARSGGAGPGPLDPFADRLGQDAGIQGRPAVARRRPGPVGSGNQGNHPAS